MDQKSVSPELSATPSLSESFRYHKSGVAATKTPPSCTAIPVGQDRSRAKIVLLAAQGKTNAEIARRRAQDHAKSFPSQEEQGARARGIFREQAPRTVLFRELKRTFTV